MREFFKKHLSIPRPFWGFLIYLLFLIPLLIQIFQERSVTSFVTLALLLVYLKAYRDGFFYTEKVERVFYVQLILASIITLLSAYGSIFIYTGFQYPFAGLEKNKTTRLTVAYYICAIASSSIAFLLNFESAMNAWLGITVGVGFILVVPIIALATAKASTEATELNNKNARMDALIIRQNERDRIARDLHDNLGQSYTIITLKAELASKLIDKDIEASRREMEEIANVSRDNLRLVREIVANLHVQSIASVLLDSQAQLSDLSIRFRTQNEQSAYDWPSEVQYRISAIIKEAVTNVIRHSQANLMNIVFAENDDEYLLEITDNGVGISAEAVGGYGIEGMKNRVLEAGGRFNIDGSSGTKIELTLAKGDEND